MYRAIRLPSDIRIYLAENDEQGQLSKGVSMVSVEHPFEQEECLMLEAVSLFDGGEPIWRNNRLIQVHGYSFKYSTRCEWVGNNQWNEYSMPCQYAVGFLNLLIRTSRWSIESGYSQLTDKWYKQDLLTLTDFGFEGYPAWQQTGYGFHVHSEPLGLFDTPLT